MLFSKTTNLISIKLFYKTILVQTHYVVLLSNFLEIFECCFRKQPFKYFKSMRGVGNSEFKSLRQFL